MSREPLQYLPPERWGELQALFKQDWTRGVGGYLVLDVQKQWVNEGIGSNFKVYCPYGEVRNGMVAVIDRIQSGNHEIIIQCPNDDLENLAAALKFTKIINWKHLIKVQYAPNHVQDLLKKLAKEINLEIKLVILTEVFILETNTPYTDVNLPEGIHFDLLKNDYLDLVDSTWPYRYQGSASYFKQLIDAKRGYGLYLNKTLICWILINESGNLLHLYTIQEERKKGYAELLLKLVSNILIENGKPVVAHCVKDNTNAYKLYMKAGFAQIDPVVFMYLKSNVV
uniref:Glycine N-acyltransferase-like protein n=1 Tax=Heliothis virescens TaxID=7102 RepID=A0A2A4J077_HELVI